MYCRKKNRGRWRRRVEENLRRARPRVRGQSVETPTVREVVCTIRSCGGVYVRIEDMIDRRRTKCRSIRHRGKERLTRTRR